ncbi:transglutaminaseTgpA domain-containing protein [Xylanimonas sp. McL0601]|uniref:transglutaminase family protein n=1 Tax=Xylanimonas sp. McL0601 TaxID=3414739 RepID=UPI003CE6F161
MIPARTPATVRLAVSTGLVTVAVLASMLALTSVVLRPWPAVGVVGVLLVGATLVVARAMVGGRRARVAAAARAGVAVRRIPFDDGGTASIWPTLAGAVVAAWYLLARFGGVGGSTQWFVTTGSVSRLFEQLGLAGDVIRDEVAPVIATPPTALLCVGGSLIVLIMADALASGLRHPLLAGSAVLVLWLPPLILMSDVPWQTFAVTVAALLLGLTLDEPTTSRRALRDAQVGAQVRRAEQRRAVRTTVTAAGITVVAMVAAAASAGLPGLGTAWTNLFTTSARSVRLADDLDMYRSLTSRSGAVVLSYTTSTGDSIGPLRLMTLSSFDGRHWNGGPDADGVEFAKGQVLFPQEVHPEDAATRVDVTVGSMREDRLPVSIDPRTVRAQTGWRYDAGRDEVVGGPATQEGDTFTLEVHSRNLTPESLRDAPSGARKVDDAFLRVPDSSHKADIAGAAKSIVGGALTDYDRAVALQTYLRDTSRFTYDVDVPRGRTGDAVWDFLQQRQGYCVQFATTMVMLARTLGIPARLAVGYLPGTPIDGGVRWDVTGEDSHAWPELYFPGKGWVRFEPTPAIQTGAAPAYADPTSGAPGPAPTPTIDERSGQTSVPSAQASVPVASPRPLSPAARAEAATHLRRWLVGSGVALVVGAGLVVLWLRRRSTRPPRDAEDAWARVVAALGSAGVTLPTATTPHRAPQEAASAWAVRTGDALPGDVRDGLATLADLLEAERYAADPEPLDAETLAQLTREVTAGIASANRPRLGAGR